MHHKPGGSWSRYGPRGVIRVDIHRNGLASAGPSRSGLSRLLPLRVPSPERPSKRSQPETLDRE